jgi:hypothetical protein
MAAASSPEWAMCDKCAEIDKKIEHYRLLASRITDQPLFDGIKELIERMQAQEAALHPDREQQGRRSLGTLSQSGAYG